MATKTKKYSNSLINALNTKATPQTKAIPGRETEMAPNNAGGFSFVMDEWAQLDRFLILGCEGGSYYATEQKMAEDNAKNVVRAIKANGVRAVARIVEISNAGRAPKNDPALYALALAMTYGDEETKIAAYAAIPKVARIGTHLLHLAAYVNSMRGWGRGLRRAFGNWYAEKEPKALALQLVKYANRDGWTHKDILRLAHPKPNTVDHNTLLKMAAGKAEGKLDFSDKSVADFMDAVEKVKTADLKTVVKLIGEYKLPREVLPTEILTKPEVWEALLPHMGMEAMVRNLGNMTRSGMLAPLSSGSKLVVEKMLNSEIVRKSRIHPIKVLAGLLTYGAGHGVRGNNVWTPTKTILDALDDMFYSSFLNVEPTGKNFLLGLDVSASMTLGEIAGVPGLTPRVASAALSMITARTEKNYELMAFTHTLVPLNITAKDSLQTVMSKMEHLNFGGTDCSLPMKYARQNKLDVDTFAVYTDNETWAGASHPSQELVKYRKESGRNAKLVVVGMTATGFSIADPKDSGMLDVVGFDTATPQLISDFARGF